MAGHASKVARLWLHVVPTWFPEAYHAVCSSKCPSTCRNAIRHVVWEIGCLSTCGSSPHLAILVPWGTAPCLQLLQIAQAPNARVRVKAEVKPRPAPPSEDVCAARRITTGSLRLDRNSSTNLRVSDIPMRRAVPEINEGILGHRTAEDVALTPSRQPYHKSYWISST